MKFDLIAIASASHVRLFSIDTATAALVAVQTVQQLEIAIFRSIFLGDFISTEFGTVTLLF